MLGKRKNSLYIKIGKEIIIIDKYGVEFHHKGDWVLWVWWWRRPSFNDRFLSISFECYFSTLKELDKMWEGYFEANRIFAKIEEENKIKT